MPDSIATPEWAAQAIYGSRSYDLYVIGDMFTRIIEPEAHSWPVNARNFPSILNDAGENEIVFAADFPIPTWTNDKWGMPILNWPSRHAAWTLEECKVYSFWLGVALHKRVEILICERGRDYRKAYGPYFVRIDTGIKGISYYIRGELDLVLEVNYEPYLVIRRNVPETGMWGYDVYLILPDGTPELVHSDTSWST